MIHSAVVKLQSDMETGIVPWYDDGLRQHGDLEDPGIRSLALTQYARVKQSLDMALELLDDPTLGLNWWRAVRIVIISGPHEMDEELWDIVLDQLDAVQPNVVTKEVSVESS